MAIKGTYPKHIGIILDGNRRFARKLMMKPWQGHEKGAENVEKLLDWAKELDIKELTLYAFSMQNFNRVKEEVEHLMKIFIDMFTSETILHKIRENGVCIKFLGRIHKFPADVYSEMNKLMESTKGNTNYRVNFAMAYGGREEIIDAVKLIVGDVEGGNLNIADLDEEIVGKYMYMNHEPDFIIRTGGAMRTSNFLIWQSSYSEWFFVDKTWPEFGKEDLKRCIEEFVSRERRFGK